MPKDDRRGRHLRGVSRREFLERLATGRVWVVDLLKVPYAVLLEVLLACRFSVRMFTLNK